MPEDAIVEEVGVGGVTAEWVSAPGASENKAALYLHGGGHMIGSTRTHRLPMFYLNPLQYLVPCFQTDFVV